MNMGYVMDGYETLADIMKALAHPVRLQILKVLRDGEACVCHLEAVLGQRQAYISQQLMRLRDAGLVVDRREGMNVFYSVADDAIARFLDAAESAAQDIGGAQIRFEHSSGAEVGCSCPKCQPEAAPESRVNAQEAV
jgi:DNA-binding transcriptional ArsR family regulator